MQSEQEPVSITPVAYKQQNSDLGKSAVSVASKSSEVDHNCDEEKSNSSGGDVNTSVGLKIPKRTSHHKRHIITLFLGTAIPMATFTAVIMGLVFQNMVTARDCAYPDFCSHNATQNGTDTSKYYYIDVPAARLVFIASWSSTFSFTFTGLLMAMYSYVAASRLLKLSEMPDVDIHVPTTYQIATLIRVLNAEPLTLYQVFVQKIKSVFWKKAKSEIATSGMHVTALSILVLSFSFTASMLIQAADTYLHVSTSAVNFVHTEERTSQHYDYGTGLAPACIYRDTYGSATNVNYWGCTLTVAKASTDPPWRYKINNYTEYYSLGIGSSESHDILEYVGNGANPIMVLVPKSIPSDIDYSASSFGSSSQCQFIRNSSCVLGQKTDESETSKLSPYEFNCSVPDIPLQVSGKLSVYLEDLHQMNFHRLLEDNPPFNSTFLEITQDIIDQAKNVTNEEGKSIFRNPWNSLASMSLTDFPREGAAFSTSDDRIFWYPDPNLVIFCTHTMWDVNYTIIRGRIAELSKNLSNSSTTGTASMPASSLFGFSPSSHAGLIFSVNNAARNPDDFLDRVMKGYSRIYLPGIASQAEFRPAHRVQSRVPRIVSRVTKPAFWILIVANILYIVVATVLGALALWVTSASQDISQLRTRLSVAGLAAQLLEGAFSERAVKEEKELFENQSLHLAEQKRVKVRRTEKAGTVFEVVESH